MQGCLFFSCFYRFALFQEKQSCHWSPGYFPLQLSIISDVTMACLDVVHVFEKFFGKLQVVSDLFDGPLPHLFSFVVNFLENHQVVITQ